MTSSRDSDSAFDTVLEEYLTGLDGGGRPDRSAYLSKYPHLAGKLQTFFENLDFVDSHIGLETPDENPVGLKRWFTTRSSPSNTAHPVEAAISPLPQIEGFHLLEELGGGSQGIVYKAEQLGTRRLVALKVIREGAFAGKSERRRFENEVELASRLSHPNIVALFTCGHDQGRDYYAMEFVEGEPLDVYLENRNLDVSPTLLLFQQICEAVSYAHQRGIIHRDLKPSNILVDTAGVVHILDFGLAKPIPAGSSAVLSAVTQVGDFAGTWYYASPEQARKDPSNVDVRSDVYTLGVLLYEMLTDCYPYPIVGESRDAIAQHILQTPPTRPSALRSEIDDELETIVFYALRKESDRRYQSVAALAEDIRRYLNHEAIEAKRDRSWYIIRKTLARHRGRVAIAAGSVFTLVVFAVVVTILYLQTLAARATVEARSVVIRESQRTLLRKLEDLNVLSNRLAGMKAVEVASVAVRPLDAPVYLETDELLAAVAAEIPKSLWSATMSAGKADARSARSWLSAHEVELESLASVIQQYRLGFPLRESGVSTFTFTEHPGEIGNALLVADVFLARAWTSFLDANDTEAIRNLELARLIGLDLADGPWLMHKSFALTIRDRSYQTLLNILNEVDEATRFFDYADWMIADPPLPDCQPAFIAERLRLTQVVEASTYAATNPHRAHLDLDVLNQHLGGLYGSIGLLTEENRRLAMSTAPQDAVHIITDYVEEAAHWDTLTSVQLTERSRSILEDLSRRSAWPLVRPVIPFAGAIFKQKGDVQPRRQLAILTAQLCRQRCLAATWSTSLSDLRCGKELCELDDPFYQRSASLESTDGIPILRWGPRQTQSLADVELLLSPISEEVEFRAKCR